MRNIRLIDDYISWFNECKNQISFTKPHHKDLYNEYQLNIEMAKKFKQLCLNSKNMKLDKSPYSDSFYLHPKGTKIGWGTKPEGSYRFSDHWNWEEENEYTGIKTVHCPTDTGENFGIAIAVVENGKYKRVY